MTKLLAGGKQTFMELARLAPEVDPDCSKIIEEWDNLNPAGKKAVSIDAMCKAKNVDPIHFISLVNEAALRFRDNASVFLAATSLPKIVEKSIKVALTKGGVKDREMMMKHSGFLPVPAGATFVNTLQTKVETNVSADKTAMQLPSFEHTVDAVDIEAE